MKNERIRICDTFEGQYSDKLEPYVMTLQLTFHNNKMIQFYWCSGRFSNSAKKLRDIEF